MIKSRILYFFCCFFLYNLNVYTKDIIGKVIDEGNNPIAWATVTLCNPADSTIIKGCITDSLGRYIFTKVADDKRYIIHVSRIGYKGKWIDERQSQSVSLVEDAHTINDIVVKGHRPFFTQGKDGTLVVHVKGTPLEHENNSVDLLHQIPGILGTGENIRTFIGGQTDIYINGKKVQSLDEVKRLSPKLINTVSVNTNPGAEFNSSPGAVVLIETKQNNKGWFFSGDTYLRQNHKFSYDNALSGNYYSDKLTVSGRMEYSDYRRKNWQDITMNMADLNNQYVYHTKTESKKWISKELLWSMSLDYTPSVHHALGLKYDFTYDKSIDDKILPFEEKRNDTILVTPGGWSKETDFSHRHYINAYYKWMVSKKVFGENYFDYLFVTNNNPQYVQESGQESLVNIRNSNRNHLLAFSLKQHFLYGPYVVVSIGEDYSSVYSNTHLVYTPHLLDNTNSTNTENKLSGFIQIEYQNKKGLTASVGLREEYTHSRYDDRNVTNNDDNRSYHTLLPSAMVNWKTGDVAHSFTFGSSVIRPPFAMLNGSSTYINQFFYQESNPRLKSQYNYRLQYDCQFLDFNFIVMYQYMHNAIQNVVYQQDNSTVESTFDNISRSSDLRLMGNWRKSVGPFIFTTTGGYIQHFIKVPVYNTSKKITRPQFYFREVIDWKIQKNIGLDADYEYTGKSTNGFYYTNEMQIVNIRFYHTFFNDNLQISLSANDLLNQNRSYYHGTFKNIFVANRDFSDKRSISIDLKWNIHQKKKSYEGDSATEDIDRL